MFLALVTVRPFGNASDQIPGGCVTLNSCRKSGAAYVLIVIVFFGIAKAWAAQDASAENLRQLGLDSFDQGRYSDAERDLRLALDAFAVGRNSFGTAQTFTDLAAVLSAEERFLEAERLLDLALQLMPEGSGAHARETARVLGYLAALYEQTGRNAAAESAFNRAVRVLEQYEPEDPHVVALLSNLGSLRVQTGNYKQAQIELRKALDLGERRFGADHRDLVPILINLAGLYQRRSKWVLAESYLLRAASIIERSLRPDHPDRAVVLEHLGVVHYRQRKLSQAETELRHSRVLRAAHSEWKASGVCAPHCTWRKS